LVYYFFKYKIDKGHKIFKKDYELALFIWLVKLFYEKPRRHQSHIPGITDATSLIFYDTIAVAFRCSELGSACAGSRWWHSLRPLSRVADLLWFGLRLP
jgi:hypothetical protein